MIFKRKGIGTKGHTAISAHRSKSPLHWSVCAGIAVLSALVINQIQTMQHREAIAAQAERPLQQLAEDLDAIKTEHRLLQATWRAELLAQLVPTLADEPEAVKRQFLDLLEEIGASATPAFIALLADPSESIRKRTADRVGRIGEKERKAGRSPDAAALALATALTDPSESVFREVVQELENVRPTSEESLAVILPALRDSRKKRTAQARNEVVDLLGRIGEDLAAAGRDTDRIRDALIAALTDESTKVRTNAVDELSDIRAASAETFGALIDRCTDTAGSVRARAEAALIELGEDAPHTLVPMLATALEQTQSPVTRGHLVDVLGGVGEALTDRDASAEGITGSIVDALRIALTDTVADVRRNAADELGEMRAGGPDVRKALTHARNDADKAVRKAAERALRRIEKGN